jgi:hypothetical protein
VELRELLPISLVRFIMACMRAGVAMLLLAGLLTACAPTAPPLPYQPAVQPAGATISAAYTVVADRLRVEIESGGRRLERAQIVRPDGSLLEAQTIEITPASGGGWSSPLSLGVGVGGVSGGGVGGGVGVSTGGMVGGGGSMTPGSSIASFPLADAGPRPWRVRVKLVGVEPAEILVGDP